MIKHYDVTLGAAATQITSTRKPCVEIIVQNGAQGSTLYVGDSSVTDTSYGHRLGSDEAVSLDGTACSINTNEVYLFGTQNEIVHVLVNIL